MPRGKKATAVKQVQFPEVAEAPSVVATEQSEPVGQQTPELPAGEQKQWARPYKAVLTCPQDHFELGENFQFRQVVFTFDGNPGSAITQKLKDAGFKYRPNEKSWTITGNAANREMAYKLAQEFRGENQAIGQNQAMSR
jgi:hypothetical protein